MTDQRQASRRNWTSSDTLADINSGSLQRIADACEKMCLDREKLERDYRHMRDSRDAWERRCKETERSNSALRGVITKLKRKCHD